MDTVCSNHIEKSLWDNMPFYEKTVATTNSVIANATDLPKDSEIPRVYLIENGTKWGFAFEDGYLSEFGVEQSRIVQTTWQYLSLFPDGKWITYS